MGQPQGREGSVSRGEDGPREHLKGEAALGPACGKGLRRGVLAASFQRPSLAPCESPVCLQPLPLPLVHPCPAQQYPPTAPRSQSPLLPPLQRDCGIQLWNEGVNYRREAPPPHSAWPSSSGAAFAARRAPASLQRHNHDLLLPLHMCPGSQSCFSLTRAATSLSPLNFARLHVECRQPEY